MKKILILTIFLFTMISLHAQEIFKLRANICAVGFFNQETNNYDKWEEPIQTNILIVFGKTKIIIYSKETQNISILTSSEKLVDSKGNEYFYLKCVDGSGIRCDITFYLTEENKYTLFLQYSDVMFAYNCVEE